MFGLQESIYHGVPSVLIPIFGDQFDNAVRLEEKGLGKAIWNKFDLNEETVLETINQVLSDDG